jgi:uncharacterized protein (DUF1810 family)
MSDTDTFDLQRFVDAQQLLYGSVCSELRSGRKQGHWMWFIFPQIVGLGSSEYARRYALSGLPEAKAYLDHPILGSRLRECTDIVNQLRDATAVGVFGPPDDLKFRSSMTLFAHSSDNNAAFMYALNKYFGGSFDPRTLERL